MALTKRQRQVLDVIHDFIEENGYSPSLEEIGGRLGLSSVATVHKHVSHLVQKGYARRAWNQNRSIELVDSARGNGAVQLPLLGTIAAGFPLEAVPTTETAWVPPDMVRDPQKTYVLGVHGDSMIDAQIRDGDQVIVERRETARRGETVVARLTGDDEWTLKRFYPEGETVRLEPANPTFEPILVPGDQIEIQGVVVGLIRKY